MPTLPPPWPSTGRTSSHPTDTARPIATAANVSVMVVSKRPPPSEMLVLPTRRPVTAATAWGQLVRCREICTPMVPAAMATRAPSRIVVVPRRSDGRSVGARKWRLLAARNATAASARVASSTSRPFRT